MKKLALLSVILVFASAKLSVYQPTELVEEFQNEYSREDFNNYGINYTIANFGHIPYGKRVFGPLVAAEPYNACQPLASVSESFEDAPIMIVERGGCTFVTKVKNAQTAGAKMAIIADNQVEKSWFITMQDDGMGDIITIPSIFIDEEDGQLLKNQLDSDSYQKPMLVIQFDVQKTDLAHYYFFLNLPRKESFVMIREFDQHRKKLDNKALFQPVYEFFPCWSCAKSNYTEEQENCLGGGRYCAIDPDGDGIATGKHVAQEQLRQLCIHQEFPQKWWKYMEKLDLHCPRPQSYEKCGVKRMAEVGIDNSRIESCISKSYIKSSAKKRALQQNSLLDNQLSISLLSGVIVWPAVVVNNVTYKGSLDAPDLMEVLCNSLNEPSIGCQPYVEGKIIIDEDKIIDENLEKPNTAFIVTVVIVILILFSLFMIFIYRKMVRKEINREMNTTVNQMVSQYIAFYETKDKSRGDL